MERNVLQADALLFNDGNNDLLSDDLDFERIARELVPTWLPTKVQDDAVAFAMDNVVLNNTIESNFYYQIKHYSIILLHLLWYGRIRYRLQAFVELLLLINVSQKTLLHMSCVCAVY